MKKLLLTALLLSASVTALADDNEDLTAVADPQDPCTIAFCMGGKVTGNSGGDDCEAAEGNFFKIVEKGKHGSFRPDATAKSRLKKLNECNKAPADMISGIISKFGRVH